MQYPYNLIYGRGQSYDKMVSAGVFHPEDRLELINGEILEITPQSSAHATAVCLVDEALRAVYVQGFTVRIQVPMALGESSEPEPDVAVVRGRPRDYLACHPTVAVLIVEISDSSLRYDREHKKGLYAASGTPEYWIAINPQWHKFFRTTQVMVFWVSDNLLSASMYP